MRTSENSLQATIKDGVLVTAASRQEALSHLLDLHNLLQVLPVKWHNTQITSKGVYIRVTLTPKNAYHHGSGKTIAQALTDLKTRLVKRGVIPLLPIA